jgi:hypothetical protein
MEAPPGPRETGPRRLVDLPEPVLLRILARVHPYHLHCLLQTCTRLRCLVMSEDLWAGLVKRTRLSTADRFDLQQTGFGDVRVPGVYVGPFARNDPAAIDGPPKSAAELAWESTDRCAVLALAAVYNDANKKVLEISAQEWFIPQMHSTDLWNAFHRWPSALFDFNENASILALDEARAQAAELASEFNIQLTFEQIFVLSKVGGAQTHSDRAGPDTFPAPQYSENDAYVRVFSLPEILAFKRTDGLQPHPVPDTTCPPTVRRVADEPPWFPADWIPLADMSIIGIDGMPEGVASSALLVYSNRIIFLLTLRDAKRLAFQERARFEGGQPRYSAAEVEAQDWKTFTARIVCLCQLMDYVATWVEDNEITPAFTSTSSEEEEEDVGFDSNSDQEDELADASDSDLEGE